VSSSSCSLRPGYCRRTSRHHFRMCRTLLEDPLRPPSLTLGCLRGTRFFNTLKKRRKKMLQKIPSWTWKKFQPTALLSAKLPSPKLAKRTKLFKNKSTGLHNTCACSEKKTAFGCHSNHRYPSNTKWSKTEGKRAKSHHCRQRFYRRQQARPWKEEISQAKEFEKRKQVIFSKIDENIISLFGVISDPLKTRHHTNLCELLHSAPISLLAARPKRVNQD
jgi:hypothetical protein